MGMLLAADNAVFQPPGPEDFVFPTIFGDVTKPMLQIALSIILVVVFFWLALRKASLVPGKLQFAAEGIYDFARNSIGRDLIGSKDFRRFVPLLVSLFTFVLVNNLFGFIPFLQFPTMSRPAFPYVLTLLVWLTYNIVGIKRHGFAGYLKLQTWPPGVPAYVRPLLTPLEFMSNILIRPVSLSLRLFANMFAGHLILLVFTFGGEFLLIHASVGLKLVSPFAFAFAIVMTLFEVLIQFLQAYIFALLTASYIGSALVDDH